MKKFDIIIVGFGPAGCFAAYLLSQLNINILLIDRKDKKRFKPCGGGIPATIIDEYPIINKFIKQNGNPITNIGFTYKHFIKNKNIYSEPVMYVVDRTQFDYFLLQLVEKTNVTVLPDTKLIDILPDNNILIQNNEIIKTDYVLLANGSSVEKNLIKYKYIKSYGYGVQIITDKRPDKNVRNDTITINFGTVPQGYDWYFPAKNSFSLGYGSFCKYIKKEIVIDKLFNNYFKFPPHNYFFKGSIIPTHFEPTEQFPNIVPIGDAAGLTDPLTGEGIDYAFLSAKIIYDIFKNHSQQIKNKYNERLIEIQNEFIVAERLSQFCYTHPFITYICGVMPRSNRKKFLQLFYKKINYTQFSNHLRKSFLVRLIKKIISV